MLIKGKKESIEETVSDSLGKQSRKTTHHYLISSN
jgi:hypothetical protein